MNAAKATLKITCVLSLFSTMGFYGCSAPSSAEQLRAEKELVREYSVSEKLDSVYKRVLVNARESFGYGPVYGDISADGSNANITYVCQSLGGGTWVPVTIDFDGSDSEHTKITAYTVNFGCWPNKLKDIQQWIDQSNTL